MSIPSADSPLEIRYATRTGALARIDGAVVGAFDREHHSVIVPPARHERELTLDVERFTLPTNGLPSGDGLRWRMMVRDAHQEPQRFVSVLRPSTSLRGACPEQSRRAQDDSAGRGDVVLWGHSHLDVAWLWPYSQTRRKAARTFANALAVMEHDPSFVFMQSQPQLYAYVEEDHPALFERVRARAGEGRWSAEPAALWVEPDCNCISGESLVRQMLYAHAYCVERFGIEPSIAWLPDTFGFPNTLPTLLAHAGIPYFATTKLQWNDTTRFPYPQFRWRGPDGSDVVAAMLDAYEGGADAARVQTARHRDEPLVIGYGDGGGGPTLEQVDAAQSVGRWESPARWFARLREREATLAVHDDELYLEYHRGTYTTHHDMKAYNASLERQLVDLEERLAWCVAVRAPREILDRLVAASRAAWEVVLRNQFHDVLPGTSVPQAYDEARAEYAQADELVKLARTSTESILPRAPLHTRAASPCAPRADGDGFLFDNGIVRARFSAKGALLELATADGPNLVAQANLLAAYRDRPKKWDAWNLDDGYQRRRLKVTPQSARIDSDGLVVTFDAAGSPVTMVVTMEEHDPFVRVDADVQWRCDRTMLRLENWLTLDADAVRYGAPHGTILRSNAAETPAQRARFEVPGQRYAAVQGERGTLALLTLDTYGWSARRLKAGVHLGHSLLRSPRWPDPSADRGMQRLSWAFAPFARASVSEIERTWERFAMPQRVRLFTTSDPSIVVTSVKPAHDGDGLIVRVRECDGESGIVRLRCGGRMRAVEAVDALERPVEREARIEGEEIVASIEAYALRSFRVRL